MRKIIINGNKIDSREALFASLREQLPAGELYGNNLDALADVLTESADTEAEIVGMQALRDTLGDYADRLLRMLESCCVRICGEWEEKDEE